MNKVPAKITLTEVAERISAHLKRFEADPVINKPYDAGPRSRDRPDGAREHLSHYWGAGAGVVGNRVNVVFVSYQQGTNLTRREALHYLNGLDGGYVGTWFGYKGEVPLELEPEPEVRFNAIVADRFGWCFYAVHKRTKSRLYGKRIRGSFLGRFVDRASARKLNATEQDYENVVAIEALYDLEVEEVQQQRQDRLQKIWDRRRE